MRWCAHRALMRIKVGAEVDCDWLYGSRYQLKKGVERWREVFSK